MLLSAKAGLRAGEIAQLTWDMVVDGNGRLGDLIEGGATAPRKEVAAAASLSTLTWLLLLKNGASHRPSDDVIRSERGGPTNPLGDRRLVQSRLQEYWAEGMFVAFRPPNVRHPRRSRGSRGRWLAA